MQPDTISGGSSEAVNAHFGMGGERFLMKDDAGATPIASRIGAEAAFVTAQPERNGFEAFGKALLSLQMSLWLPIREISVQAGTEDDVPV